MRASANIAGHPIHPILVTLPVGLWVFSLAADLIFIMRGNPAWVSVAFYTLAGGIVGAALAAVFGLIDLLGTKDERVFKMGLMHAGCVVAALIFFIASFYLRTTSGSAMVGPGSNVPVVLSVIGVLILLAGGWLGGELVFRYGAAVNTPETVNTDA
jgi:uncharacterized membrane protein